MKPKLKCIIQVQLPLVVNRGTIHLMLVQWSPDRQEQHLEHDKEPATQSELYCMQKENRQRNLKNHIYHIGSSKTKV